MVRLISSKKAGQLGAGIGLIVAVIYFFFFIMIVNSAENVVGLGVSSDLVTIDLGAVEFDAIIGSSFCANPRNYYNADTGEQSIYTNAETDRLFCEESAGVLSSSTCNDISGCNWTSVTSGFWFWTTTSEPSCIGDINSTTYGIEKNNPFFGRPRIVSHNNTGYWESFTPFDDPSVCTHPNVIQNKTLCNMFSCQWELVTADTSFNSVGSVYSTISEVFTFRYDFGFTNQTLSLLMNFIFIVLPLLLLIVSLYFMLPVVH